MHKRRATDTRAKETMFFLATFSPARYLLQKPPGARRFNDEWRTLKRAANTGMPADYLDYGK